MDLYLGIDFGTSGARAIAIDQAANIQATQQLNYEINSAISWRDSLYALIAAFPVEIKQRIRAIAIDATSATVLMVDRDGNPIAHQFYTTIRAGRWCWSDCGKLCPKIRIWF
jgi:sugar (pentulose or hexulose) kinase